MRLTYEHLKNIKLIYESETQSIDSTQFVDEKGNPHLQPWEIIDELLELDIIESEHDQTVFFLTPLAYEVAEGEWEIQRDDALERESFQPESVEELIQRVGAKKTKQYVFLTLLFFAVLLGVYVYLYSDPFKNKNTPLDAILTEEVINDMKNKADSLSKLK